MAFGFLCFGTIIEMSYNSNEMRESIYAFSILPSAYRRSLSDEHRGTTAVSITTEMFTCHFVSTVVY